MISRMEGEEFPGISYADFRIMSAAGFIVDGSKGGLILGPPHIEGSSTNCAR